MSKLNNNKTKTRKLHFNRICRSCLTERGHLRELLSTRLPRMMKTIARIEVTEDDELPSKVCVSCFHQIAKFYTFKKKLERNDRILRNYLKQKKHRKPNDFLDILDKAVNEAEIAVPVTVKQEKENVSEDEIPLSERITRNKKIVVRSSERLLRKSKQKANKIIDTIIKEEEWPDNVSSESSYKEEDEEEEEDDFDYCDDRMPGFEQRRYENAANSTDRTSVSDEPPPLVPLVSSNLPYSFDSPTNTVQNLPENAPPLVPIKPFSSLSPATIVNALADNLENPVKLHLQCNICNEEFHTVFALKHHRLYQCQPSGMQCNICKKEFHDRNRLIGHLKGHMVSKDYACKICGKRYPNPSTFRVHMRTHTGERPFKCQVCNKGFVRWAGVVGHMKTHNTNKPFKCDTCGKGFKISSNLERHKVLHFSILPFCCSYCGKTFSQSDNLQLHVRTYHTNDRPYLCNECGKRFVSSTRLKRHMWVHTGFKPYRCRYCPKAYSNCNDRKNHEKSHTGGISEEDKPHVCRTCDMRFLHACRLAKHMKTHERPYPCTECSKTFSSETLLNKHLGNKHGTEFLEHLSVPLSVEEVYINYQ